MPFEPPRNGLGYWSGAEATGRGIATCAVAAMLRYARQELGPPTSSPASRMGTTAVPRCCAASGFRPPADFDAYTRLHLALAVTAHGDPDSQLDAGLRHEQITRRARIAPRPLRGNLRPCR